MLSHCTAFSHLRVSTVESAPRLLDPEQITIGNSTDIFVELRCFSTIERSGSNVSWVFAENNTAVSTPLTAFGSSQGNGVLRVAPSHILSPAPNGTLFYCMDVENNDTLKVKLELRKLSVIVEVEKNTQQC